MGRFMTKRNLCFTFATLVLTALYWAPLKTLATFSIHSNTYPYNFLIPLLSAFLIYLEKDRIFSCVRYDLGSGLVLLSLALVIRWSSKRYWGALSPNDALALVILSFVVLWVGVFVLCYGTKSLQTAAFQQYETSVALLVRLVLLRTIGA